MTEEPCEMLTLEAPVRFWRTLAVCTRALLALADAAAASGYSSYCPRIGAQEAAEAFLAAARTALRRKRTGRVTLSRHVWTWLARGFYEVEAEKAVPEIPVAERPTPWRDWGAAGRFLAALLARAGAWPTYHGATRVDLTPWGQTAWYSDWVV